MFDVRDGQIGVAPVFP